MPEQRTLIVGNWKMHGTLNEAEALASSIADFASSQPCECDIVLCPPATHLHPLHQIVQKNPVMLGGQDCHFATSGAYTGDISAEMLRESGCDYVIIGHSERRAEHFETNHIIKQKAEAAHNAGLISIICVGENEEKREEGKTTQLIASQITACLPESSNHQNTVIAYEPIWAIGTGNIPTKNEIKQVHRDIIETIESHFPTFGSPIRILYGGSVKPTNAEDILSIEEVSGLLVGGASLKAQDFCTIIEKA